MYEERRAKQRFRNSGRKRGKTQVMAERYKSGDGEGKRKGK